MIDDRTINRSREESYQEPAGVREGMRHPEPAGDRAKVHGGLDYQGIVRNFEADDVDWLQERIRVCACGC